MVQILPSAADQLAPTIEGFAQGLEKYMKPDADFQKAMQKAVGGNPQLAQQLADLEYQAPGTLDNMGFGNLGKVISKIPESEKSQFLRTSRGAILDEDQKKLQLEKSQTGFSFDRLMDTIDLLHKNPTVAADSIMKSLGLKSGSETAQAEATLAQTKAGTASSEASTARTIAEQPGVVAKTQAEVASADVQYKALSDLEAKYPAIHGMDPMGMVRDMMAGKSVPALQSYMMLPGAHEALSTAQTIYNSQMQRDERELLKAQTQHGIDAEEKQNIIQAGAALRASGRAGTLTAWRTVLEHPDVVEAIRGKKPEDLSPGERDIMHAATAQQEMQDRIASKDVNQLNMGIRQASITAQSAVKQAESPAGIALALTPLNNILAEKAGKTGEGYSAVYGPAPEVGETGKGTHVFGLFDVAPSLYYIDKTGKRVEDNVPFADPVSKSAKVITAGAAFLAQYTGDTDKNRKATMLARLKKEKPDVYESIKDKVGGQ